MSKNLFNTPEERNVLKQHGFKWYKDQCTDRVESKYIKEVIPIENGFRVVYNEDSVIEFSDANVDQIEWREHPDLEKILVALSLALVDI